MTNISKRRLNSNDENQLIKQLSELLTTQSQKTTEMVLDELLGYEEKIMLAKRFAVVVLLYKKYSTYGIAQKLYISTSTVARIENDLKTGRYRVINKLLHKPSASFVDILEAIDNILHLGGILPHYGESHRSESFKKSRNYK